MGKVARNTRPLLSRMRHLLQSKSIIEPRWYQAALQVLSDLPESNPPNMWWQCYTRVWLFCILCISHDFRQRRDFTYERSSHPTPTLAWTSVWHEGGRFPINAYINFADICWKLLQTWHGLLNFLYVVERISWSRIDMQILWGFTGTCLHLSVGPKHSNVVKHFMGRGRIEYSQIPRFRYYRTTDIYEDADLTISLMCFFLQMLYFLLPLCWTFMRGTGQCLCDPYLPCNNGIL